MCHQVYSSQILNIAKTGSIGGLGKGHSAWDYDSCYNEAKKYKTKNDFSNNSNRAYTVARINKWLKDYTWFENGFDKLSEERKLWAYEKCSEESKKYSSLKDFRKFSHAAYTAAYKYGYLNKFDWLKHEYTKRGTWKIYENCYEEAKKYSTLEDFKSKSNSCYSTACKNKWIDDYTWLERKRTRRGYWQNYDNCYNEAKKYKRISDFQKESGSAYNSAWKNGWLEEYTWLVKEERKASGYWTYERCLEESKKFKSRSDFALGNGSAYNVARKNGWLEEYTWFSA